MPRQGTLFAAVFQLMFVIFSSSPGFSRPSYLPTVLCEFLLKTWLVLWIRYILESTSDLLLTCSFDFLLKLETLENLSPAVLSSVGMLCMNTSDVNWPLLVDRWLAKRPEREVDVLRELCDRYIEIGRAHV